MSSRAALGVFRWNGLVQPGFKPHPKQSFGGARYDGHMMGGRLVHLLARRRGTRYEEGRVEDSELH